MSLIRARIEDHIIDTEIFDGDSAANTAVDVDTPTPGADEHWLVYGVNAWYSDVTVAQPLTITIDPGGTPRTLAIEGIQVDDNRTQWAPVQPVLVAAGLVVRAGLPAAGVAETGHIRLYAKKVIVK